ncbi:hypothetical protein K32_47960 [Kaistia sp. 32K]|uniref:hypothetical protein n=1 Tax=Kaistia sp. 32K TaxID=2795690 RepID=UPI001914F552|nr:hypothetical protein [Kaistia sp. 32K]BCP56179.1 hypothetical protein K32_47960 [Kaistia sp. 32K]
MQRTARYIEEMTEQLSELAKRNEFHDLAYLLSVASAEAREAAEQAKVRAASADLPESPAVLSFGAQ